MTRYISGLFLLATASVVMAEYFVIGFMHILPGGLDHILFILGLFFLTRSFGTLLFQMTIFTLAHSLTLGLSLYGVVTVPMAVVDVAIALSIAFIAIENLFLDRLSRWRPAVVFVFGLVHGLGFAHSFEEKVVASGDFLPALFSFNMGIEIGQIGVVAIAYAAVAPWWNHPSYRKSIARPASAVIAAAGFYWAIERCF